MHQRFFKLRKKLDRLDHDIILLFAKRMKIVRQIGRLKKDGRLPIYDRGREQQIIKNLGRLGSRFNLSKKFIKELFLKVFRESRRVQKLKR